MIKEHLTKRRPLNKKLEKIITGLIFKTGINSFGGLKKSTYRHYPNSPSLSFILGLKLFQGAKYEASIQSLKKISSSHILAPESFFIRGAALTMLKKPKKAHHYYQRCHRYAANRQARVMGRTLRNYFGHIAESCIIHRSRLYYQQKKYQKALDSYHDIPKVSTLWPSLLLEKAWSNYQVKNYNRTLGLLVTYKSPLLSSYFYPEADVLRALSYFRLCLWNESLQIVKEYYDVHRGNAEALKKILLRHKDSKSYFIKLMLLSPAKQKKLNPFIRNLSTQIGKKVKFTSYASFWKSMKRELTRIKRLPNNRPVIKLKQTLEKTLKSQSQMLNRYVKNQMFEFLGDMRQFSIEMSNIQLKSISYERTEVYRNKKLTSKRFQGSLANVRRTSKQYFYSFDGEFWADELGDYSFGLKSSCRKKKERKGNG